MSTAIEKLGNEFREELRGRVTETRSFTVKHGRDECQALKKELISLIDLKEIDSIKRLNIEGRVNFAYEGDEEGTG